MAESPFKFASVRLAFKGNYVVFPLDQRDFFAALGEIGFTVARQLPRDLPPGVMPSIAGAVARADGMLLDMDMDRQVLGLEGQSVDQVIEKFSAVETLLNDRFGMNLAENTRFYETIAAFQMETGNQPIETIGQIPGFERVADCFRVLGQAVSPLSIRVRFPDKLPGGVEWFEMTIEPFMLNPKSRYYINSIFRSAERARVFDFTRELQARTVQIVGSLESLSQHPS